MYKIISINGKEYKLEYSIEASLYSDCATKTIDLMTGMSPDKSTDEIIYKVLNVPETALTLFYAGLIEHHGVSGDHSIMSLDDAKALIKDYLIEHKDDDEGNWWAVLNMCINQMAEDGFFKLIGLETLANATKKVPVPKVPQDHKKKASAK